MIDAEQLDFLALEKDPRWRNSLIEKKKPHVEVPEDNQSEESKEEFTKKVSAIEKLISIGKELTV